MQQEVVRDVDGDTLTFDGFAQATNGTVSLNNGVLTYAPNANFNGTDSFTYFVSDGNGGTDTGQVSITVSSVNDPPVADDETYTINQDTTLNTATAMLPGVLVGDTDGDGDPLSVVAETKTSLAGGTVTINADGSFTYTPAAPIRRHRLLHVHRH